MNPKEREDQRYRQGVRCKIDTEERLLLDYVQSLSGGARQILDLGCGTGEMSLAMTEMGHQVRGVDFSEQAIAIARKAGVDCAVADIDNGLPFEDASFDLVWATDVIEHVFDPINALTEISRVLKPEGRLVAIVPNDVHLSNRVRTLLGQSYQEPVYRQFGQYKHHTFFSLGLLQYMLDRAGLAFQPLRAQYRLPLLGKVFYFQSRALLNFSNQISFLGLKKSA